MVVSKSLASWVWVGSWGGELGNSGPGCAVCCSCPGRVVVSGGSGGGIGGEAIVDIQVINSQDRWYCSILDCFLEYRGNGQVTNFFKINLLALKDKNFLNFKHGKLFWEEEEEECRQ